MKIYQYQYKPDSFGDVRVRLWGTLPFNCIITEIKPLRHKEHQEKYLIKYSGTLFSYLLIFLEPRRGKGVVLKSYKAVSSTSSVFENYSGMEMETSHLCVWHFRESDIIKPVFSDPWPDRIIFM